MTSFNENYEQLVDRRRCIIKEISRLQDELWEIDESLRNLEHSIFSQFMREQKEKPDDQE